MILKAQVLGLALLLGLSGCAYPIATTDQGAVSAGLYFPGARPGAIVSVDGAPAGVAARFDGRKTLLTVSPGPHRVRIQMGDAILYDQSVFVGAGSRMAIKAP